MERERERFNGGLNRKIWKINYKWRIFPCHVFPCHVPGLAADSEAQASRAVRPDGAESTDGGCSDGYFYRGVPAEKVTMCYIH